MSDGQQEVRKVCRGVAAEREGARGQAGRNDGGLGWTAGLLGSQRPRDVVAHIEQSEALCLEPGSSPRRGSDRPLLPPRSGGSGGSRLLCRPRAEERVDIGGYVGRDRPICVPEEFAAQIEPDGFAALSNLFGDGALLHRSAPRRHA